jgi:hypothetical protein
MFVLWNIYLSKLVMAALAVLVVSEVLFHSGWLFDQPPYLLLFGMFGGLMFVWWTFVKIRCPKCGTPGWMTWISKRQPGVDCPRCGIVYAKDLMWSFQILVEPHDEESSVPHEESSP